MNRYLKLFFTGLVYFLLFLILVICFVRLTLNLDDFREDVQSRLIKETGLDISIGSLGWSGVLGVKVDQLSIAMQATEEQKLAQKKRQLLRKNKLKSNTEDQDSDSSEQESEQVDLGPSMPSYLNLADWEKVFF